MQVDSALIEALRGAPGLSLAVIGDQTGCFTALVIGGVAVTVVYADRELRVPQILRQIVLFPPFLALVAGIALGLAGDPFPPLALFSVGLQQRLELPRARLPAIGCALAWKLLLAPALCYLLGRLSGVSGLVLAVGVLQAGMPPMISAAILADQYRLEPGLANSVLAIAILLSLASVPWLNTLL